MGHLFVLSGPAGGGKTTLVDRLTKEFPYVKKNVSYTTRPIRPGEVQGVDYHFVSKDVFLEMVKRDDFLETVSLFGHLYGTSKKAILGELEKGFHLILVIDVEGAHKVRELLGAPLIFVSPPSLETLKKRLSGRGSEKGKSMDQRLQRAVFEMEQGENHYDYLFVNDELEVAYEIFKSILVAELHKRTPWIETNTDL
jgi:guanylate kinase